jgi:hypothetical protein
MKELKPIEESWNKKRIIIGLFFLFAILAGLTAFKVLVLDQNQNSVQNPINKTATAVEGVSTTASTPSNDSTISGLKTNIQDQLNTIKQEASNINLTDIATSSPQVQKVIDDIKSIQNLPRSQAKSFCDQICSGL